MLEIPLRISGRPPLGARPVLHPLAVGLVHDWMAPAGLGVRDASPRLPTVGVFGSGTSGNPSGNTWASGPSGPCINFDDSGTGTLASPVITIGNSSGTGGPGSTAFSIQARIRLATLPPPGGSSTIFGANSGGIQFRIDHSGTLTLNKSQTAAMGTSSGTVSAGRDVDIGVSYDGAAVRFYIDGKPAGSASSSQTFSAVQYFIGARDAAGTSERLHNGSRIYWLRMWNRARGEAEFRQLNDAPHAFYDVNASPLYGLAGFAAAAGAAALAGAAVAQAQAAAALTTQIQLAGAALNVATAAGTITTQIPLAGAAVAVVSAGGALTAQIRLAGAAVAQALAAAGLTTQIPLAGGAAGQATAAGALTTGGGGLAGNAAAVAAAAGALSTSIKLVGSAAAIATATGALGGTAAQLAGAAGGVATAQASLTANIRLTAAALAQAAATGSLTVSIRLAGAAAGQATAGGELTVGEVFARGVRILGRAFSLRAVAGSRPARSVQSRRPGRTQ